MGQSAESNERRRYDRHTIRGEARIEPLRESDDFVGLKDVYLLDIGRTGVRFLSSEPLTRNSHWRLRIVHRGHALAMVPILVRYVERQAESGSYHVGAQFMIEPAVLSQLGVSDYDLSRDQAEGRFLDPVGTCAVPSEA
ncbi:hypothetical protein HED60_13775 [Planctomycetales bacterium ZRK34]|nr:hypothetical protein HED60_13775 [Planctomycetales bacterium ZRK34]